MPETGLDPTIPLGVKTPAPAGSSINELLGTVGAFADVQNKLNTNRLFQQTFAARQRAGEIMATAPDMDTGLKALSQDPLTTAFVPEIVSSMYSTRATQLAIQGAQQEQSTSAFGSVVKGMALGITDPAQYDKIVNSEMSLLPKATRDAIAPAIAGVRSAMFDGLPGDFAAWTPADRDVFDRRVAGMQLSANVSPELIRGATGGLAPQVSQFAGPSGEARSATIGGPAGATPGASMNGLIGPGGTVPGPSTAGNGLGGALPPPATATPETPGGTSGPGLTKQAELTGAGATGAEIQDSMAQFADVLPLQLQRMDQIVGLLEKFQSGGFASDRAGAAQVLQGLNNIFPGIISQADINKIANGNLAATQEFKALAQRLATQQLSQDVKGQGKAFMPEVQSAITSISADQDPAAIIGILNYTKKAYEYYESKADKWLEFKQGVRGAGPLADEVRGLDLADYNNWYNRKYGPSPGEYAPYSGEKVLGVSGTKPSLDLNKFLTK